MKIDFGDITQISIAIIGLIGTIYANRRKKIIKRKEITEKAHKAPRKYFFLFWISIALICINLAIFGWRIFINDQIHLEIIYPNDGSHVSINEIVKGKSNNVPSNKMIWIIIYSYSSGKYFPSHIPAHIDNNGNWSSSVIIGSSADIGKRFHVSAYLIDESIRNKLEVEFNRLDFAGLEKLPSSIQLYHRISVIRR